MSIANRRVFTRDCSGPIFWALFARTPHHRTAPPPRCKSPSPRCAFPLCASLPPALLSVASVLSAQSRRASATQLRMAVDMRRAPRISADARRGHQRATTHRSRSRMRRLDYTHASLQTCPTRGGLTRCRLWVLRCDVSPSLMQRSFAIRHQRVGRQAALVRSPLSATQAPTHPHTECRWLTARCIDCVCPWQCAVLPSVLGRDVFSIPSRTLRSEHSPLVVRFFLAHSAHMRRAAGNHIRRPDQATLAPATSGTPEAGEAGCVGILRAAGIHHRRQTRSSARADGAGQ